MSEPCSSSGKPHADTISVLAVDHYIDMAVLCASPLCVVKSRVEPTQNRLFPSIFLPLYSMNSFSNIPYADEFERARRKEVALGASIAVLNAWPLRPSRLALCLLHGGIVYHDCTACRLFIRTRGNKRS